MPNFPGNRSSNHRHSRRKTTPSAPTAKTHILARNPNTTIPSTMNYVHGLRLMTFRFYSFPVATCYSVTKTETHTGHVSRRSEAPHPAFTTVTPPERINPNAGNSLHRVSTQATKAGHILRVTVPSRTNTRERLSTPVFLTESALSECSRDADEKMKTIHSIIDTLLNAARWRDLRTKRKCPQLTSHVPLECRYVYRAYATFFTPCVPTNPGLGVQRRVISRGNEKRKDTFSAGGGESMVSSTAQAVRNSVLETKLNRRSLEASVVCCRNNVYTAYMRDTKLSTQIPGSQENAMREKKEQRSLS